jgi:ribose 5-phosphate isomerase B
LKIAVGSDEKTVLTDFVVEELKKRGHAVTLFGPLKGEVMGWPDVGEKVGLDVSKGRADQGVLFCWTGTGVTIAANKVSGSELLYAGTRKPPGVLECGTVPPCW